MHIAKLIKLKGGGLSTRSVTFTIKYLLFSLEGKLLNLIRVPIGLILTRSQLNVYVVYELLPSQRIDGTLFLNKKN